MKFFNFGYEDEKVIVKGIIIMNWFDKLIYIVFWYLVVNFGIGGLYKIFCYFLLIDLDYYYYLFFYFVLRKFIMGDGYKGVYNK